MVDRTGWTAPWAGGAATLMEKHFNQLGWASDAPAWAPMARLTAKPAYQSAMAGAIGEFLTLVNAQASAWRVEGSGSCRCCAPGFASTSTGVQLRAARDALVNYDSRLRRRGAATGSRRPAQLVEQLALIDSWAVKSQAEIAASAAMLGGSPIDESATVAVYCAKGSAMAAFVFLDTMHWPEDAKAAAAARNAALEAWKEAAEFHPLIVLNGSPDGSAVRQPRRVDGFPDRAGPEGDGGLSWRCVAPSPPASPTIASAAPAAALK